MTDLYSIWKNHVAHARETGGAQPIAADVVLALDAAREQHVAELRKATSTAVEMPHPTLHAGMRLVTSAYARAAVADYGNARAAERDAYWQAEIDRLKRVNGAELVEFLGIDPVSITSGAHQPMIPDSWRFGFVQPDGSLLRFQRMDAGPLVAWEAVERFVRPQEGTEAAYWHKRCIDTEKALARVRHSVKTAHDEFVKIDQENAG